MRIVINHLTRMQKGFMCVAGIEQATLSHIRPVVVGRLGTDFLSTYGGPFDMAWVVDLGKTEPAGSPPEVEDYRFDPERARRICDVPPERFWELLTLVARPSLKQIFGPELRSRRSGTCCTPRGAGLASLGCLRTASRPQMYVAPRDGRPLIRMRLNSLGLDLDLSVTDIRLYGPDHVTPNEPLLAAINERLRQAPEVILSVGLTRPHSATPDEPTQHWLQVNNLHFADNPCWRLESTSISGP